MLALVIDTSSAAVTAGIVRIAAEPGGGRLEVLAERVTVDARAHGELLAPSISQALDSAGVAVADLDAVVAGLGPGPFTGLRVGLVTAAALADVHGLPTYGVCSLDGIEAAAPEDRDDSVLLVASDARRKEVYWALYRSGERLVGPEVDKPARVRERLAGGEVSARTMRGAGARLYADELGLPQAGADYPTVAGLACCAAARVLDSAPTERLTPLYLRRPDAVAPTSHKQVSQ